MSKIEVNAIEPQCGTNLTVGASGDTITFPTGTTIVNNGTQTGFGRTGTVDWDTTAKTASFTAVSGEGYFINTAGGAVTVTLPASPSAGNIVSVSDYNGSAGTNEITVARNSSNINGNASDYIITKADSAITFVYVDATVGWTSVQTSNTTDNINPFIVATGGTITCCGDFKIHTFTGPGTFTVSNAGNPTGSDSVDYLVVAGGGGSGVNGGGGGAGGYRESCGTCYTSSPLGASVSALPVTAQGYSVTVGGGGAGNPPSPTPNRNGCRGSNSIFSTITSTGGGGGQGYSGDPAGAPNPGGSGGGGSATKTAGGTGNTPPVSPPQGQSGGTGGSNSGPGYAAAGGGGAGAVGTNGNSSSSGGGGGNGVSSSITGSAVTRSGGGGGGVWDNNPGGSGGSGGGGAGGTGQVPGTAGTANTGGGAGGPSSANQGCTGPGGVAGGSGIVIIRYKYQ
jgi:hypothetical protein